MRLFQKSVLCLGIFLFVLFLSADPISVFTDEGPFQTPEKLVRGLYASVTFDPGMAPDWDHVRKFFLPQGVIAARQTRTAMGIMDVDAFIDWFKADVEKYKMKERGFEESVEKIKLMEFGDMAHCFVVYKARFKTPDNQPGQLGLDSFGLVKKDGRWWIVSITNDVVDRDRPLPEELR